MPARPGGAFGRRLYFGIWRVKKENQTEFLSRHRRRELRIDLSFGQRISILIGLAVAGLTGLLFLDPIPQDPAYHLFADTRTILGISNFNDVLSNVGLGIVGVLGVVTLMGPRGKVIFHQPSDARPYLVFFTGVALISLGSAYYHWAPSNFGLFWDRLPMAVAFMAFCAAIIADRIDADAGNGWLLALLIGLGILSLAYWHWTESQGRGDLRLYGFVQFYPMVVVPIACTLFPAHRYTRGRYIFGVIALYGLAKVFEWFDGEIFEILGGTASGHTLKHLVAAVAIYLVLQMLVVSRRGLP